MADTTLERVRRAAAEMLLGLDVILEEPRLPPFLRATADLLSPRGRTGAGEDDGDLAGALRAARRIAPDFRPVGRGKVLWLRVDDHTGGRRGDDGTRLTLEQRLAAIDGPARDGLRSGAIHVIVDHSHEGRSNSLESPYPLISDCLAACGVDRPHIAVLNQNVALDPTVGGEPPVGEVRPISAHRHLTHFWHRWTPEADGERVRSDGLGFALDGPRDRPFRYICLNFHLRPARALVVARLIARPERGHLSFSVDRRRRNATVTARLRTGVAKLSLAARRRENVAAVDALIAAEPTFKTDIDGMRRAKDVVYTLPVEAFTNSELYIVTETEMEDATLQRFTEKTLKAIVAGIPYVVFGNPGTIAELRRIGFDPLDRFIDHGYDAEEDPARRFEMAWTAVETFLARKPGFTDEEMTVLRAANLANDDVFGNALADRWIIRAYDRIREWRTAAPVSSA